jgi:hypothetical protein
MQAHRRQGEFCSAMHLAGLTEAAKFDAAEPISERIVA